MGFNSGFKGLNTIPCCATVYTLKGTSGSNYCKIELGYNVMKGTEYFVSVYTSVVINDEYIVMVNSDELIRATQYLTL